jgi:hypothetical protein
MDNITHLRRGTASLLAAGDAIPEIASASVIELSSHIILDRGRIVGRWDFDTGTGTIAWSSFVKKDRALEAAVARMETYVREDLGDARTVSLDSPKSRAPRIAALRKSAAG